MPVSGVSFSTARTPEQVKELVQALLQTSQDVALGSHAIGFSKSPDMETMFMSARTDGRWQIVLSGSSSDLAKPYNSSKHDELVAIEQQVPIGMKPGEFEYKHSREQWAKIYRDQNEGQEPSAEILDSLVMDQAGIKPAD